MIKDIELITLEEAELQYKNVANIGKYEDSPVWIYSAKLTNESFVRLWQLGGGTCRLETEESEPEPEESVHKILYTAAILRKKGIPLKSWDISEATHGDYWDSLVQLAQEETSA